MIALGQPQKAGVMMLPDKASEIIRGRAPQTIIVR